MVHMNVLIPIRLHKLFVKKLAIREHGLVLNVSSTAAIRPIAMPYLSLYSASKCFTDQLTNSIDHEYSKNSNLLFKTLILTHLTSYLFKRSKTNNNSNTQPTDPLSTMLSRFTNQLLTNVLPSKQKFISKLLESNYSCKTTGHWLFAIEYFFIENLPQFLVHLALEYLSSEE